MYFAKLVSYKEPQLEKKSQKNNLFFSQKFTGVLFLRFWGVIQSAFVNLLVNGEMVTFLLCLWSVSRMDSAEEKTHPGPIHVRWPKTS